MRTKVLAALFVAVASAARADHDCLEERPNGDTIVRKSALPAQWFVVGGASIIGPTLHAKLKTKYESQYESGFEEGEYGYLCLQTESGYVAISTNDFGVGVEYSRVAPKCLKCFVTSTPRKQFRSGTGLHLGQTKAQVSSILGAPIASDLVEFKFEATETESNSKVWHSQVLRLEFSSDVLVRFSVDDYREGA